MVSCGAGGRDVTAGRGLVPSRPVCLAGGVCDLGTRMASMCDCDTTVTVWTTREYECLGVASASKGPSGNSGIRNELGTVT